MIFDRKLKKHVEALTKEISDIKNAIPSSAISPDSELWKSFTIGNDTYSGVHVTENTALAVSSVYACVGLVSGAIASMPVHIYKKTDKGREKIINELTPLLNDQALEAWSAPVFWEYIIASIMMHGDGIAKIVRPSRYSSKVKGFDPIHPNTVDVIKTGDRLTYIVWRDNKDAEVLDQDDILHIPGLGFNGLRGMSNIKYGAKNAIGTSLASDEYNGSFFKNSARPDIALETDQSLSEDQARIVRETWYDRYQGASKSHLPAVLVGGLKVKPITMSAEDAQLIQTRQFQVEDIARFFGVPPFMIGHTEKTTSWGSGVEQMSIGFVKYTLSRYLIKLEAEINRKCIRSDKYFCEFNVAGLERGDIKTRNEAYRIALGRAGEPGWMTVNEVRSLENLPPDQDGDKLNKGEQNASNDETVN